MTTRNEDVSYRITLNAEEGVMAVRVVCGIDVADAIADALTTISQPDVIEVPELKLVDVKLSSDEAGVVLVEANERDLTPAEWHALRAWAAAAVEHAIEMACLDD